MSYDPSHILVKRACKWITEELQSMLKTFEKQYHVICQNPTKGPRIARLKPKGNSRYEQCYWSSPLATVATPVSLAAHFPRSRRGNRSCAQVLMEGDERGIRCHRLHKLARSVMKSASSQRGESDAIDSDTGRMVGPVGATFPRLVYEHPESTQDQCE